MNKELLDTVNSIVIPYLTYYDLSKEEQERITKLICIDLEIYIHKLITEALSSNSTI